MATLNAYQQVFGLSLMCNLIQNEKGAQIDLQSQMEKKLPPALQLLGGNWRVTWGPLVWKNRPDDTNTGPSRVCFVARNPRLTFPDGQNKETYVLAVSDYNNNVHGDQVVDYDAWLRDGITILPTQGAPTSPQNCYISNDTALGVYHLARIESPRTAASPGIALPSYWASFPPSPDTTVILTGLKLGGAISSALAFGLLESMAFSKFTPSNILVYPVASPAPGNLVFSQRFSHRFPKIPDPGSGYQVWNSNIV